MYAQQYQAVIDACYDCALACDTCAGACLREEDVKMMSRCIALDMDCAQICRLAATYMARGSQFAGTISQACAEVCDACASECAKHPAQHCQECARACQACAAACRTAGGGKAAVSSQTGATAARH